MPSLLEAAASLSISAGVMVLVTTSLSGAARIHAACAGLANEMFAARQVEQLVDRATLLAGAGPGRPPPVSSVDADTLVFGSDHNGDGIVDTTSSETTALEVRLVSGQPRVRVRLGRQTMTVLQADDNDVTLAALDADGRPADAATATFVELAIAERDPSPDASGVRRMLFSLPARTVR